MRAASRPMSLVLLLGVALLAARAPAGGPASTQGQPASVLPNLNTLTDAEKAAGWKLLFDGKTTHGWRNFKKQDISEGWKVIDGALCRVAQSAGDIITADQYDNFVLELDYKLHEPYFQSMDEHVRALNKKFGKQALLVVPAGQAVIALREKIIAGQAPGLKAQEDLFSDAIGHPKPPLQALVAYCHFAVIYRQSPVGLHVPTVLAGKGEPKEIDALNRLLQELAWDAVVHHPLTGVQSAPKTK